MSDPMVAHEQRIVQFLSRPASYPGPVGAVERRETHVSHVFLAGTFAYKLKKPVKFPFLDASTLALRRKFCLLELSLNRRLAPAVYLDVVPVVETPARRSGRGAGGPRGLVLGGKGRVIEWLVRMHRLPEGRMLDRVVARRRVSRRDMVEIADRLSRFFRSAPRSRAITRYGEPARVESLVLGNLEECRPFLGSLLREPDRALLDASYRQFVALYRPLLAARARSGRIIDGHGDLRCENICLPREMAPLTKTGAAISRGLTGPVIFDCVEFEPAFRCADLANDFSFLVMDLEFRGRLDLADTLVRRYRARIHDPTFDAVLPFYKCHRSLVRGKVRGFAWLQHPTTAAGRRIRGLSRRHFALAVRYARHFAPPRLIVVGGLIGSGKSTLARSLAQGLGAAWLRTDEIRLTEFASARRPRQGFSGGIYAPQVSARVYERLIRRAEALLRAGRSVVCDGMFATEEGRHALRRLAKRRKASFHFVECVVPRAIALRRIAARAAAKTDLSEARPEHYDRLKAGFEPVRGFSRREWTRLSDNRSASATYQAALRVLRRVWLNP